MNPMLRFAPTVALLAALAALCAWLVLPARRDLPLRVQGMDGRPDGAAGGAGAGNPVLRGKVIAGEGKSASLDGTWSRFRGDALSAGAETPSPIPRPWAESGPPKLWSLALGEGYAGAAIWKGRAFLTDYDREKKEETLRCLSLDDGRELWRYAFPNTLKRDHGVTRTVPAVTSNSVVAIGPKCHVLCVETGTGKLRWSIDMVKEFGTTVPPWYTGQCPFIDGDRVILAPAGSNTLMLCAELATGKVLWQTPNPRGWKMSHSSVMPVEFAGKRMFVYPAGGGVVGVSADDGAILWDTTEWKISLATVPCAIDLGGGRVFFTGGYNAGSLLLRLKPDGAKFVPEVAWRLKADVFGATQHSPVLHAGHLFGVRADGRFVCLSLEGKVVWTSEPGLNFGLGSFIRVGDAFLVLNDSGTLHLIEANALAYRPLGKAKVLDGPESWAPMAFADGRVLARDLHKLVCLDLGGRGGGAIQQAKNATQ
jgi:outer membrane protein assembly factor BamB